jgi:import inner membrane translocase subunit TIM50
LDRYNFFITHRLFREGTRYLNGKIVKVRELFSTKASR